jgi:hypothetical protein
MPALKRQHHPEFVALAQVAAPPPTLASAGANPHGTPKPNTGDVP